MTAVPDKPRRRQFAGLILAGGRGSRLQGRDKGLVLFQGRALIEYPLAALSPVTTEIYINANRNQATYRRYGRPVISDAEPDYAGPLAGILAGLSATQAPLLVCPCDCPGVTTELFRRLAEALQPPCVAAIAHDGRRQQPAFLALDPDTRVNLEAFLSQGQRRLQDWLGTLPHTPVDGSDHPEWFSNINSPADLAALD